MAEINLTASMRTNLLSLQQTEGLMAQTQERLSTGLKVNSAIDDPTAYYTAQGLSNRANDLSALMDSMGQGISTLKATDEAIQSITEFVDQAKAIVSTAAELPVGGSETARVTIGANNTGADVTADISINGAAAVTVTFADGETAADNLATLEAALGTGFSVSEEGVITYAGATDTSVEITASTNSTVVSNLMETEFTSPTTVSQERVDAFERFSEIMVQIDNMAGDASYKGVNLLDGASQDLTVYFNEDRTSFLTVDNVDATAAGLGLTAVTGFGTNAEIDGALNVVDEAIDTLRGMASDFGNQYAILQNWENFTDNMINTLTEGADKLTLADMNEEGANMLALQTRQQLATNALSLASQSAQSVLSLF